MIPSLRQTSVSTLRNSVRSASKESFTRFQKLKIRLHLDPHQNDLSASIHIIAMAVGITALTLGAIILLAAGITFGTEQWRNQVPHNIDAVTMSSVLAIQSSAVAVVGFLVYLGGPNSRHHMISLSFPVEDNSLAEFMKTRTAFAFASVAALSFFFYSLNSSKLLMFPFSWTQGICFAAMNSAFVVSLVNLVARRWIPSVRNSQLYGCALFFALPAFAALTGAATESEIPMLIHEDLREAHRHAILFLSPQSWVSIAFLQDEYSRLLRGLLLLPVVMVVARGMQCFYELLSIAPIDPMDGDFKSPNQGVVFTERKPKTSNEASVMRRLKAIEIGQSESQLRVFPNLIAGIPAPSSISVRAAIGRYQRMLKQNLLHPIEGWANRCLFAVLATTALFVFILSVWESLFDESETTRLAIARCILIATYLATVLLPNPNSKSGAAYLFPISMRQSTMATLSIWIRNLIWASPLLIGLNLLYFIHLELSLIELAAFILRTASVGIAVLLVQISTQYCSVGRHQLGRSVFVAGWSGLVFALIAGTLLLVCPVQALLDEVEIILLPGVYAGLSTLNAASPAIILAMGITSIWLSRWTFQSSRIDCATDRSSYTCPTIAQTNSLRC